MSERRRRGLRPARAGSAKPQLRAQRADDDLAVAQHARVDGPPVPALLLAVQRTAGNAAATRLLHRAHTSARPTVVQRCGPVPCDCPDSVRARNEAPLVARSADLQVQRWSPFKLLGAKKAAAPAPEDPVFGPEDPKPLVEKAALAAIRAIHARREAVQSKFTGKISTKTPNPCGDLATQLQACLGPFAPGPTPTIEESLGTLYAHLQLRPGLGVLLARLSAAIQPFVKVGCIDQNQVLELADKTVRPEKKEPEKKNPMERIADLLEQLVAAKTGGASAAATPADAGAAATPASAQAGAPAWVKPTGRTGGGWASATAAGTRLRPGGHRGGRAAPSAPKTALGGHRGGPASSPAAPAASALAGLLGGHRGAAAGGAPAAASGWRTTTPRPTPAERQERSMLLDLRHRLAGRDDLRESMANDRADLLDDQLDQASESDDDPLAGLAALFGER